MIRAVACRWPSWRAVLTMAAVVAGVIPAPAASGQDDWRIESRPFASVAVSSWKAQESPVARDEAGRPTLLRQGIGLSCLTRVFEVDLDATPVVEVVAAPGNAAWRLTAVRADAAGPDEDIVLADGQTEGLCRRNVRDRLYLRGRQHLRVRLILWGWSGSDPQRLTLARAGFVGEAAEADAAGLSGLMQERHERVLARAASMGPLRHEHPSLRYRAAARPQLRERALGAWRPFAVSALSAAAAPAAAPAVVLTAEAMRGSEWRPQTLALAPPVAPALAAGQGWSPWGAGMGASVEGTWRALYWHFTSALMIGSAVTADDRFAEQARRWALAVSRWQFWRQPHYATFDFATSYPLQNLCQWYDIGHAAMSEAERAEVREAIAALARGLYLNALTGHGSIYNDLRGNHTAVTFCGLGTAGLVLLDEHPEAPAWAALAEQFMLDAFAEHRSGAWTESPCYGNYGVSEWFRLAELLRNTTGHDHFRDPFLKRYADFSLMISDWDGINLAYNQGGQGSRWNHWVFFGIAREWRSSETQWLAAFDLAERPDDYVGYGDAFWWVDPDLPAARPSERNAGRAFEDVGVNVWRSGWEDDATILLHHCGRKGQHKEQIMNHVTLYAHGRRLLRDGLGSSTRDHNVPVVAGQAQNTWHPGETLRYHSDEHCGYALGALPSYSRGARRHVLYLRAGVVCLIDDLDLGAAPGTTAEFLLHPNGRSAVDGGVLRVTSGDVVMDALVADPDGTVFPIAVTAREQTAFATHDVVATRRGQGPTRTVTLLRFGPASLMTEVSWTVAAGEGYLDLRRGDEHWRLGLAPGPIAAGWSTDAALWLCRLDDGSPAVGMAIGATPAAAVVVQTPRGPRRGNGAVSWADEAGL
ncbi:MAG: DUF4962 domain-containing protein [Lentisphaerae bacterium]|nr:DUF4962 domain-containing protein [Lentisphaerota bacterium]